ncbi:hypothetical protein [Alteromonas macleodii]|uniref:Uncharacterized protein n=1 Tax=Alteromonas macleodii TaxID=28108 RepID=A0AB36FR95_ALTMA|nr:hypothetical protein [Alteromonas macleodii]OES24116.1 hypothetical protein BFV95_4861 [Alteromonas macleodii]OES24121.1 hypothetical protein BFV94_4870 [Alteromonas macleodii]OES25883.1 hypothetical protein BFV93_4253 [Alteromonas macleodii]OES38612.1 hypothetical protein BFV96_4723 [Alteromonas macleodii]OES38956.1 hypothetical protein BFV96_4450 [Alteromonas macleodii]
MTTMMQLPMVFILGSLRIPDLAPNLPFADKIRTLSKQYPQFRQTTIYPEDGVVKDGVLEFKVPLPPPKSNG